MTVEEKLRATFKVQKNNVGQLSHDKIKKQ